MKEKGERRSREEAEWGRGVSRKRGKKRGGKRSKEGRRQNRKEEE